MADSYTVNKMNKESINAKMKRREEKRRERTDLIREIPKQLKRKMENKTRKKRPK